MECRLLKISFFIILMTIIPITIFSSDHNFKEAQKFKDLLVKGETLYKKGYFENAALSWEAALKLLHIKRQPGLYIDTLLHLADAYHSLGYFKKGIYALHDALPIILNNNDRYRNVQFLNKLGVLYYSLGNLEKSFKYLVKGLEEARKANNPHILSCILNDIGNCLVADHDYETAIVFFEEAFEIINESSVNIGLKSKILINLLRIEIQHTSYDILPKRLSYTANQIKKLPDSHQKAADLISLSILISQYKKMFPKYYDHNVMSLHYNILVDAKEIAKSIQSYPLLSYAYGYLGSLYENTKQYKEARSMTRKAIFYAMQGNHPEILYLWEWQSARIFKTNGDIKNAIKAYQKSISTLEPIRIKFFVGFRAEKDTFNKQIKPVYLGLAELLLIQAETIKDEQLKQSTLLEVIKTMERLKTAELQDFFEDECTVAMKKKQVVLSQTPERIAVLYPIPLKEKLILLLILPDGIHQISVAVGLNHLYDCINKFRKRLQTRTNNRFLYEAQKLYDWIIRPVKQSLHKNNIDTLIFAPDGPLRLVPLSTLHDENKFLIESYAVGLIPAISLTDPKQLKDIKINILINGLYEARQGFSCLPSVKSEIQDIKKIMNGKVVLENSEYTIENLINEFKNDEYSIVHIATHGVFGGTPQESFLLSYENKLNMDQLENLLGINRFQKNQVELLN